MAEDYGPDIVTVEDEDGNVHTFEIVDAVETDDAKYVAIIPVFDKQSDILDDSGELIILEVQETEDAEILAPIEDDDVFDEISAVFEERLAEYFEIEPLDIEQ